MHFFRASFLHHITNNHSIHGHAAQVFKMDTSLTRSLREPGGPCTKSMEDSESRMERVKRSLLTLGASNLYSDNGEARTLNSPTMKWDVTSNAKCQIKLQSLLINQSIKMLSIMTLMNPWWAIKGNVEYGTAKKKRPGYLVGNLVATNWPIEKALHAIGYNQIPTK